MLGGASTHYGNICIDIYKRFEYILATRYFFLIFWRVISKSVCQFRFRWEITVGPQFSPFRNSYMMRLLVVDSRQMAERFSPPVAIFTPSHLYNHKGLPFFCPNNLTRYQLTSKSDCLRLDDRCATLRLAIHQLSTRNRLALVFLEIAPKTGVVLFRHFDNVNRPNTQMNIYKWARALAYTYI